MNRTVRTLLGLLAVGLVALTSCKQDRTEPQKNEGSTYVSVAINLQSSLRAGTGETDDEFNLKGTWNGKDAIETIAVYVVGDGSVSYGQYTMADFDIVKATDGTNITIKPKPNKAILTKPGTKKVYALINAPEEITKLLEKSMPAHFNEAYAKAVENMTTAKVARANAAKEDLIMMSNAAECEINIKDGVTQEAAVQGPDNLAKVSVKRVVARVILTTTKDSYDIKLQDGTVLGKITDITYAVAQGERAFYISQQKNKVGSIITPGYDFLPAVDAANPSKLTNYEEQAKTYDYSDLKATVDNPRKALVAENLTAALEIGKKSLESSAFIFEASHAFGGNGQTIADYSGGFRRGNTPYVLVRAKFTPNDNAFYNDYQKNMFKRGDGTFYRGEDGLLYARNKPFKSKRTNEIVPEQKYTKFEGGKVLYHVFVNPDNVAKTLDAPAYRNNIYHISVSGFKTLGLNWNPLYPEDPDNPKDNPDPKPKDDPNTPPYVPGDFNTPKETYLAVEVNVIPWNVHSYDIELSL
ncbi:Mfa1 family fimbria major subunit [uncultured Porphyromonas sp.]|uniref:Mfa1 family fimbria major subunit n=2 Tax=uncultured Porphyromonas sp. TaxID=159274 RepID=UPI00262A48BC|nr:Mfa1 family fimbria major subunit [uncultured Porphyromonas sp.]